jgi:hypothetical protein
LPFDNLQETLLNGGVAPRHVRRYLAELRDHLEDLTARQREAGYEGEDATARARALLGHDQELATAMLEQKQFRSWAARAPWAVFLLLPPLAAIAIGLIFIGSLLVLGIYHGFLGMQSPPPPQWFQLLATDVVVITNLAMTPLAATWFAAIAARQRLNSVWPLAATALLLILFVHSDVSFLRRHENLDISFAPIFMASAWKMMAEHARLVTAQYLLTIVSSLWLVRRRMVQN